MWYGSAIKYGLIGLGGLAAIAFPLRLLRRLGRAEVSWINAAELHAQLKNGIAPTILDVRGGDEFIGPLGHIPAALNIPLGEIPERISEIHAAANGAVILVCKTDMRSAKAAKLLPEASFQNVHVLRGGMELWNQNGFEIERC